MCHTHDADRLYPSVRIYARTRFLIRLSRSDERNANSTETNGTIFDVSVPLSLSVTLCEHLLCDARNARAINVNMKYEWWLSLSLIRPLPTLSTEK